MAFSGAGNGTSGDPYIITTVVQLQEMEDDLTAYYILASDIDAAITNTWNGGAGFLPIGVSIVPFVGSLDGRGYVIYDLFVDGREFNGLFGAIGATGIVKNVGLEDEYIRGGEDFVGGLAGWNAGTVDNCRSAGSVIGWYSHLSWAGGLVGHNTGVVINSRSAATVSGVATVGGLVGGNMGGTIENCYATGNASGSSSVGGLVGHLVGGSISKCYATGDAYADTNGAGGLCGTTNTGSITNCYARGDAETASQAGGLIGSSSFEVTNCYSTGHVIMWDELGGGLIGEGLGTGQNSFWDIETSGWATSSGGTGKTTIQMKDVRTFTDVGWSAGLQSAWDFVDNPWDDVANADIWDIYPTVNNGYPFLTALMSRPEIPPEIPPVKFGRVGRKFERDMYKPFEQTVQVMGAPVRMHQAVLALRGTPYRALALQTPLLVTGVPYRTFNKEVEIKRKRGFKMLLEMLEGD